MNFRQKIRLRFFLVVGMAALAAVLVFPKEFTNIPLVGPKLAQMKVNLGLDLQGGYHLEYRADVSQIEGEKVDEALQAAQDVMERRVNPQGVSETSVALSTFGEEHRLIVEIPTAEDIEEVKKRIKDTPRLEFREEGDGSEGQEVIDGLNSQTLPKAQETLLKAKTGADFEELAKELSQDPGSRENGGDLDFQKKGAFVPEFDEVLFEKNLADGEVYGELVESQFGWHIIKKIEERGEGDEREVRARHILFRKYSIDDIPELKYTETGLTGKNLKDAQVTFPNQGIGEPQVAIRFDDEGTKLFAELTKKNIGKPLAIFLDGSIQSAPTVQNEITNGEAVITGNFTIEEAQDLVRRLNEGALPVPLELVGQQSIEASLGSESLKKSIIAGAIGFAALALFMIGYYRFLGAVAVVALLAYGAFMISMFKLSGVFTPWPITLTLSGIAGFILSIGMAVDANVLIFERTREELRSGKNVARAIEEGFKRAWPSIRDGNYSTIITSVILIWFGTSFVKGFATILVIGVFLSMFTAIVVVRLSLQYLVGPWLESRLWLIGPGLSGNKKESK